VEIRVNVNGVGKRWNVEPSELLVDVLRDNGYKSVKKGCGSADCGTCTVLVDGRAVLSCSVFAASVSGKTIETLEGLGTDQQLHPIQQAFLDAAAFQCGFCAPGLIMATKELLEKEPALTEDQIRHELSGNLCRCSGYENQVKAISGLMDKKREGA